MAAFTESDKVVNLVVACLSMAGGLAIIIGYIVSFTSGQNRMRQRLVLGLGVVDFILALTVVVGTSLSLDGHVFPTNGAACDIFGFLYQTCTIVSAAWTLTIAVVTYTTLVHPVSRLTAALEKRGASYVIWGIAWACGLVPGIIGTIVWVMIDLGGICFYRSNSPESKLMLFIPRAFAMLGVMIIYGSLFLFFQRRDMSIFDTSVSTSAEEEDEVVASQASRRRFSSIVNWNRRSSDMTQVAQHRSSLTPFTQAGATSESLMVQRPSVTSEDTVVPFPTRRGSAIVIALPPASALARDRALSTSDDASADDDAPLHDHLTSYDKRPSAGGETGLVNSQYRLGGSGIESGSPREKGPGKLSARQLNRRLSLLMGLYPLAYFVLFSVSVARLATQLATNKAVSPDLAKASRWLVLAQGFVDGILYFVIELLFRRSVRGRT